MTLDRDTLIKETEDKVANATQTMDLVSTRNMNQTRIKQESRRLNTNLDLTSSSPLLSPCLALRLPSCR